MESEKKELQKYLKIQTIMLALILAVVLLGAAFVGVQAYRISGLLSSVDGKQVSNIVDSLESTAAELEKLDIDALQKGVASFTRISDNLSGLDIDALNESIGAMSGAVENLQKLDADHLNSLIESLQKTAASIEKFTSIFSR